MKNSTKVALAVLLVGAMGGAAIGPSAFADDAAAPAPAAANPAAPLPDQQIARADDVNRPGGPGMMGGWAHRGNWGRPGGLRADILNIACGDRGAEALEIALVHVNYAVKPTATQAPLLDALKTAALADQKTFADSCKAAMGDNTAAPGKSNILDRFQARLAIETAKVTALNDVLPKFKAFYDSLTDDQKAKLEPQRGWHGTRMGMNNQFGPGQWHRPGMNGPHRRPGDMAPPAGPGGPATPDTSAVPDQSTNPDVQG